MTLHYVLGVQVVRTPSGLFLSQHKYVSDLLKKFHLHALKPARTPFVSRTTLSLIDGELLAELSKFWSIVSALQYRTITRPDIVYDVPMVSQLWMSPMLLTYMLSSTFLGICRAQLNMGCSLSHLLIWIFWWLFATLIELIVPTLVVIARP